MTVRPRKPSGGKRAQAAVRLACVFHPLWSSADDHLLLQARARGENFSVIAARLGRTRIAVEQRYHRLRVIRNALTLLESYGLSSGRYPCDGGHNG